MLSDRWNKIMGAVLGASLGVTFALLVLQGRWREAIPLHLCSLAALGGLLLLFRPRAWTLDLLWYLGMPGAALALLFPAPAVSRFQNLLNASYTITHMMILIIPLAFMLRGMRPRAGRSAAVFLILQGIALIACWVNRLLGTDFLFLAAPPMGTPLAMVFDWGYPVYLILLETLMFSLCRLMDWLAARMFTKNGQ